MRISVFGLGYVGCVSAACLAAENHRVIGVDVNPSKVDLINKGRSPIVEKGLGTLIGRVVSSGHLSATSNAGEAIRQSDVAMICVGTPSTSEGSLDLQFVERVSADIGQGLRDRDTYHVVVVRSTMLPGSTEEVVLPTLERVSGRRVGVGFGLAYNPEFLREGTAVSDFRNPPRTVIGEFDQQSGDRVAKIYSALDAPLIRTDIRTAELVKYADNAFHALKITFANEIGALCRAEGIDSHRLMDIFCQDTKLNISPAYLRPGYAFGGSCLPKDLRALSHRAHKRQVEIPVLNSILESNEKHKQRGLALVQAAEQRRIALLGLSFKPDTDDLRESPAIGLLEALVEEGHQVRVYDRNVELERLTGGNRAFVKHKVPHLSSLMVRDLQSAVSWAEVVVVTNYDEEFCSVPAMLGSNQILVDFVRLVDNPDGLGERYYGIAW